MSDELHQLLGRLAAGQDAIVRRQDEHHSENKEKLVRIETEVSGMRAAQGTLTTNLAMLQERVDHHGSRITETATDLERAVQRLDSAEEKLDQIIHRVATGIWAAGIVGIGVGAVILAVLRAVGRSVAGKLGLAL